MLRNYLLIAFRNIFRNKLFSFVNIFGLAFGISSSLLIFFWVTDELGYDKFHENTDRLYRVMENQHYSDGEIYTFSATPGPMAPYIKNKYPEIERACRFTWQITNLFQFGNEAFYEKGHYVDPDFLEMFTFPLAQGRPSGALQEKNSIVITRALAEKLFGGEDPMGKVLVMNNKDNFTVSGIIEKVPSNSTIQFDYLLPFQYFWDENEGWLQHWGNNNIRTFLQLTEGADRNAFAQKLKHEIREHNEKTSVELFIQPVGDMHLFGEFENGVVAGGRIDQVRIFSVVGIFVLFIACINFMNLATAQATRRAKEVGLRKVIGAFPGQLFRQFMGESYLMVTLATLVAVLICVSLVPAFNHIAGKELSFNLLNGRIVAVMGFLILATGFVAGAYPALFISGFKPVRVLKGQGHGEGRASVLRKALVVIQFALSIILIISTVVVFRQMNYMKHKDIGFNRDNVFYAQMEGDIGQHFDTFRQRLLKETGISDVTASNNIPIAIGNSTSNAEWAGKPPDQSILFSQLVIDANFVNAMGMQIVEGRDFDRARITDSTNFLVNEKAAEKFGFTDGTAGKALTFNGRKGTIIGVVKDFNFGSLHDPVEPLVMHQERNGMYIVMVRVHPGESAAALRSFDKLWREYAPGYPVSYSFLNQEWENYYQAEEQRGQVFNALAGLSIFISCLGLFGLSSFAAERRTKELGIRKALGASVPGLVRLMGTEFSSLVLIAACIGCPLGWFLMKQWLQQYAYHIDVGVATILLAAAISLMVALATVAYHSVKVALSDPVKSLRYE